MKITMPFPLPLHTWGSSASCSQIESEEYIYIYKNRLNPRYIRLRSSPSSEQSHSIDSMLQRVQQITQHLTGKMAVVFDEKIPDITLYTTVKTNRLTACLLTSLQVNSKHPMASRSPSPSRNSGQSPPSSPTSPLTPPPPVSPTPSTKSTSAKTPKKSPGSSPSTPTAASPP